MTKPDKTQNQIVVPHEDGWAVQKEGSDRATATFETREEAIRKAREFADNQDSEVYIHYTGQETATQ